MRQRFAIAACAVGALTLSTAWAATNFGGNAAPSGAHYNNGSAEPVCTVDQSALTVSCTGTAISGIGGTDAAVLLTVSYSATVTCTNKGGQLVEVKTQSTTTSGADSDTRVRNGTLTVAPITATGPSDQNFLSRATCPNGNWTKSLVEGSPTITSFTYTLTFNGFTEPAITISGP
jgi:hypothetical protein